MLLTFQWWHLKDRSSSPYQTSCFTFLWKIILQTSHGEGGPLSSSVVEGGWGQGQTEDLGNQLCLSFHPVFLNLATPTPTSPLPLFPDPDAPGTEFLSLLRILLV